LAEERTVVCEETAFFVIEQVQEEAKQRQALLDEVKLVRASFETLVTAFNRIDSTSAKIIDLPSFPLRRAD
jgi:hypothetical protein